MENDDLDIPAWVQKAWSQPLSESDILFRSVNSNEGDEDDWETNAWVRGATDYAYAEGYRSAGRILADHVIQTRGDTDFLAYPIVFLYRHNVELQLKMLIKDGAFLTRTALTKDDWKLVAASHRLDQLWAKLETILRKLAKEGGGIQATEIEAIASYIRQIHVVDELSFSFRYLTTKDGKPAIDKQKLPYFNIGVFAASMEKLTGYLFGLGCSFSEAAKCQAEMEGEAYDEGSHCMEDCGEY